MKKIFVILGFLCLGQLFAENFPIETIEAANVDEISKNIDKNLQDFKENSPVVKNRILFDFGAEPEASASTTYGFFQYNWSDKYSSNIKIKYSSSTETSDSIDGYASATKIDKSKSVELDLLPFVYNKPFLKTTMSFSFGISYQYIDESSFAGMFDVNGYMLEPDDKGKYFTMSNEKKAHVFAPRLGFNTKLPLCKYLSVNLDFYMNPIYLISLNQSMDYHSDQTLSKFDYSGDNNVTNWSSPYIETKLYADCFDFVRLVSLISYQRLDFQQMNWADDFESLTGYDDTQDMLKLRFGLEFLVGDKQRARAKGGIYYENNWNASSYDGETIHKGKWIISVGSER